MALYSTAHAGRCRGAGFTLRLFLLVRLVEKVRAAGRLDGAGGSGDHQRELILSRDTTCTCLQ